MAKKRTYSAVPVEKVRHEEVSDVLSAGCIVAVDVAKSKFVAALATTAGEVVKILRFEHPTQTRQFLELVMALREVAHGDLRVAMEPTGTYGDAVRYQLMDREVPVWMVSPKRTHDSQALFDNVRSLHDAKSAVLIARLCALGLGTKWEPADAMLTKLRALVELRSHEAEREDKCLGRLEALLARHWPEFGASLDIRRQATALLVLAQYATPADLTADREAAASFMRRSSRRLLAEPIIEQVLADASCSLGVPAEETERMLIQTLASSARAAQQRAAELERAMGALASEDEAFKALKAFMGTFTASTILTLCDPRKYGCPRQLEKACGLNLREKSSGEFKGRLSITKRGPSLVRKLLYLFALRTIQDVPAVRAWYMRRRGYNEDAKQRAVVAVMRKLLRAVFYVARGHSFDAEKLFDKRRLDLASISTRSSRFGRPSATAATP